MKNNLEEHLSWLNATKANIPRKEALRDITNAVIANASSLPNRNNARISTTKSSNIVEVASVPTRQQILDMPRANSNAELSPILSNVEKTTRKSSGLRLARRENSLTKSSSSISNTSKNSSPQPEATHLQQHQVGTKQIPAVIDLTFDEEVESTPIIPRRRHQEPTVLDNTNNSASKRQKPNDFTSDDDAFGDDTYAFDEELRLHDIRKQNSSANSAGMNSNPINTVRNPLPPLPAYNPIHLQNNNNNNNRSSPNNGNNLAIGKSDKNSIEKHPDGLVYAQRRHIEICERRIELLVKRVLINESTALSEDEKKRKRNELSAGLIQLENEQKQSKIELSQFKYDHQHQQQQHQTPIPTRQLTAPQTSNMSTSNILSSRAAMEVLESSRDTRDRRMQPPPPLHPSNIETINSDDLIPTANDNRTKLDNNRIEGNEDDDEEMEDVLGDQTNDGLVTSQVDDYDHEIHSSDRDFIEGPIEDEDEDTDYSAEGDGDDDDDEEEMRIHVSQHEIQDLKSGSEDETEDRIELDHDVFNGRKHDDDNSDVEEVDNGTYTDSRIASIRSEDFHSHSEDEQYEEIDNFDAERETLKPNEVIDLSDTELDIPPPPPPARQLQLAETAATPSRPVPQIVNEEDFEATFPPSSPNFSADVEGLEVIDQPPPSQRYPWSNEVFAKLQEIFKLSSFRQNQLEAVNNTLAGKDTFVLMPTGGGKSLCYQLPAVVKSGKTQGTTIVVSPLISLMQDQVEHLWEKNIKAGMINSRGSAEERKTTFNLFIDGFLDLVYLSPEMISASNQAKNAIDRLYKQGKLARIVVDEAHCVSSWGHDFRPDYKHLGYFKQNYPDIPVMALTATANDHVKMDIIHNLNLKDPKFLKQSFNRTNLFYEVVRKDKDHMKQIEISLTTKFRNQTGIIYCHSKNACEQTAEKLSNSGIKCAFYHAGMAPEDRLDIQKKWQHGIIKCICATIAFGMGIDKADVRFVIHLTLPRTLEGYYQETGRAGRDGNYSYCTMYYSFRDARTLQNMISRDKDLDRNGKEKHLTKLRQVIQYCENSTDCRRQQVLQYFNEEFSKKDCDKNCDNCQKGLDASSMYEKDVTEYAKKMTELVKSIEDQRVTLIYCQDIFKGSKSNKITSAGHDELLQHGAGKELDKVDIERIAFHLIAEKILEEFSVFNAAGFASSYIKLGIHANKLLQNKKKIIMTFHTNAKRSARPNSNGSTTTATTTTINGNRASTVSRSRTLQQGEIEDYRYNNGSDNKSGVSKTASFTSARAELQRTASNLANEFSYPIRNSNKAPGPSVTPIQLKEISFNNEEERLNFANCFKSLSEARTRAMSSLNFSKTSSVCNDEVLKQMAKFLPQNEIEFKKIYGLTEQQKDYFRFFKTILNKLYLSNKSKISQRGSATNERSKYFQSEEEKTQDELVINQLRAASQMSSSQSQSMKTSTQKRSTKSSQGGRGKKRGKFSKRGGSSGGGSGGGNTGQSSSSQKSKKVIKTTIKPTQMAMPI